MNGKHAALWWALGVVAVAVLVVVPLVRDDDDVASGFDARIQSGTCAAPSAEGVVSDLESEDGANDVEPYVAVGDDGEPVTIGYYGAPGVPGLGVAAIYTDEQFSMVITKPETGEAVACGDVLEPEADRFAESGVAVVQLLSVGSSTVQGVATLERATLQRELDITPTRARILLTADPVTVPDAAAVGYEGFIQSGRCNAPLDDVRVDLESEDDGADVTPFRASGGASAPVTVAYYGSPGAPGFGLAAAYTDQEFSMVVEDAVSREPVACGDILEPDAAKFSEAGVALVQLQPTGDAGVQGYAVLDRVGMERELDVTPTLIRILLFAAPATGA